MLGGDDTGRRCLHYSCECSGHEFILAYGHTLVDVNCWTVLSSFAGVKLSEMANTPGKSPSGRVVGACTRPRLLGSLRLYGMRMMSIARHHCTSDMESHNSFVYVPVDWSRSDPPHFLMDRVTMHRLS